MLKNNKFQFGEKEDQDIKEIIVRQTSFQCIQTRRGLELHTDASADGYGAILLQKSCDDNMLHPIYYTSKKTTDAERKNIAATN